MIPQSEVLTAITHPKKFTLSEMSAIERLRTE